MNKTQLKNRRIALRAELRAVEQRLARLTRFAVALQGTIAFYEEQEARRTRA